MLTTLDPIPSGPEAAYKNLKQHIAYGDSLTKNFQNNIKTHQLKLEFQK